MREWRRGWNINRRERREAREEDACRFEANLDGHVGGLRRPSAVVAELRVNLVVPVRLPPSEDHTAGLGLLAAAADRGVEDASSLDLRPLLEQLYKHLRRRHLLVPATEPRGPGFSCGAAPSGSVLPPAHILRAATSRSAVMPTIVSEPPAPTQPQTGTKERFVWLASSS